MALQRPKVFLLESGIEPAIDLQVAVGALAGLGEHELREVGGQDPDPPGGDQVSEVLVEEHRNAEGLLAGGAGGRPEHELLLGGPLGDELRDQVPKQLEGSLVPKK